MSVEQLIHEFQALKAEVASLKKSKEDEVMNDESKEEEEGDEDQAPSWGALLKAVSIEPSSEGAAFLCQVLSSPPLLIS